MLRCTTGVLRCTTGVLRCTTVVLQEQEEHRKMREERELHELRKENEFRARPMPNFDKTVHSKPVSTIKLTDPKSPMLATRVRHALRELN